MLVYNLDLRSEGTPANFYSIIQVNIELIYLITMHIDIVNNHILYKNITLIICICMMLEL